MTNSRDSHQFLTVNSYFHGKIFSIVIVLSQSRAFNILIVNVCHCHDFDKTMCKFLTMSLSCRPLPATVFRLIQKKILQTFCIKTTYAIRARGRHNNDIVKKLHIVLSKS